MNNQSLKPGWKKVRFGDVVHQIKDRVTNLETCGLTEYTRGEHFEPGNLRLIGRSKLGDGQHGSAFHMRFRKGDIVYVSRNPQLRKVAVTDYDGICANTTYVCRADNKNLLHELLPFIMQTEDFVEYTIRHKRGSTNFYLNWSDIAPYEFALPPLEEQKRISNILWAAEKVLQNIEFNITRITTLRSAAISEFTNCGIRNSQYTETLVGKIPIGWMLVPIGRVLDSCEYGLSSQVHDEGDYQIFRMMNIEDGRIVANDMKHVRLSKDGFKKYRVLPGDILFNRTNSDELVGKLGIFDLPGDYVFASYLIRLKVKRTEVIPEYLNYFMNSREGQRRIRSYATKGVSQTNINATNLQKVLFPLPPLYEQHEIVEILSYIDRAKRDILLHRDNQKIQNNNMLSILL